MKTPKMVEAMNYIDDDLVSGAITYTRKKKTGWLRWGAMAACLCLVITGASLWGNLGQQGKIPEAGAGVGGEDSGGVWPEGVDPVIASLAVIPAGVDLLDVADAVSISSAKRTHGLWKVWEPISPPCCRRVADTERLVITEP